MCVLITKAISKTNKNKLVHELGRCVVFFNPPTPPPHKRKNVPLTFYFVIEILKQSQYLSDLFLMHVYAWLLCHGKLKINTSCHFLSNEKLNLVRSAIGLLLFSYAAVFAE